MRQSLTIVVICLACLLTAQAQAAVPNLRLYSIVEEPVAFSIDDGATSQIPPNSLTKFTISPGEHLLKIVTQSGLLASITALFDEAQMADFRGVQTWCAVARARPGEVQIFLDTKAGCEKILSVAPKEDD